MNYKTKGKCRLALASVFLSLMGILSVAAQETPQPQPVAATLSKTEQLYVVSAQAGGVSYITGTARATRADATKILAAGDELAAKEEVSVETDGKIEVLLNPGSYLRVGGDSNFEFISTALETLSVNLARGSALVEATTIGGDKGANISITTPQTVIELEKSGLYRINVTADATEIFVWSGEARIGSDVVKKGRKLVVGKTGMATIAKFDQNKIQPDALDLWSKTRSEELAKLNRELERPALEQTFASINNYDYHFSTGYWCFNRVTRRWCYVPSAGWRCCRAYNQPHTNQVAINPSGSSGTPIVVATKEGRSGSPKYDGGETYQPSTREDSSPAKSETRESSPPKSDPSPSKSDDKPSTREDSSPKKIGYQNRSGLDNNIKTGVKSNGDRK